MKREEAIKLLNDIHSQCCDTANILCTLDADKRCDALQMAIIALQNQPVWIPVSERLPGKDIGDYPINMVTLDTGEVCIGVYRRDSKEWWTRMNEGETLYSTDHVVTAWMPLPEPYQGSEPHKQTNADRIRNMTENEAIEELKYDCNEIGKAIPCDTSWGESFENAYAMAIKALEEVQQYRQIGSVELFAETKKLSDLTKNVEL